MPTKNASLRSRYASEIRPALMKQLGIENVMAAPKVTKITLNVGLGQAKTDQRVTEVAVKALEKITGQKPVLTKAKKSIAGFKIREGMNVGAVVTLRGEKMFDFIERLVNLTLPKVRDFSGLSPKSFDKQGNYNLGFREHLVFPEIKADEAEKILGLQVTVSTTANDREAGLALLQALGFPFSKK